MQEADRAQAEGEEEVTTEDDFNAALDADPTGWQTRLVFADWLQERNDLRADGYRALGRLQKRPAMDRHARWHGSGAWDAGYPDGAHELPLDWLERLPGDPGPAYWPRGDRAERSRREVEDAAAVAFAKLSSERRAELLSAIPTETSAEDQAGKGRSIDSPA